MPEHLRALIVILVLSSLTFVVFRPAFERVIEVPRLNRYFAIWVAITVSAFVAHNIWIFTAALVVILLFASMKEKNIVALYVFIMFAVPLLPIKVPGFGVIEHLINLDYLRIVNLVLLFPLLLNRPKGNERTAKWVGVVDKLMIILVLYMTLMMLRETTITDAIRAGVLHVIDILIPYFAISRYVNSLDRMREVFGALVFAGLILGLLAAFEYFKAWLLYSGLRGALGIQDGYGTYVRRGLELRAQVSTGQPIPLGYITAMIFGAWMYVRHFVENPNHRKLIYVLLAVALFAPISRGPWVGWVAMMFVIFYLGRNGTTNTLAFLVVGVAAFMALAVLPGGERFINLLPFVGNVEVENIDYRDRLLDSALIVIDRNFWLGSVDFLETPEMLAMIQGEGIIDLVNTYLVYALEFGVIGLILFSLPFVLSGIFVWSTKTSSAELLSMRAVFLGLLLGTLVTIFTAASIVIIPRFYWLLLGLLAAFPACCRLFVSGDRWALNYESR
jgi:hypothetical protein